MYNIVTSTETVMLEHKTNLYSDSFNLNYPILLKMWCDVGYRNENNMCVDINECKIMRHFCDLRKRFSFLLD